METEERLINEFLRRLCPESIEVADDSAKRTHFCGLLLVKINLRKIYNYTIIIRIQGAKRMGEHWAKFEDQGWK